MIEVRTILGVLSCCRTWLMLTERSQQSKGSCSLAKSSSGVDSACHRLGAGEYLHASRDSRYMPRSTDPPQESPVIPSSSARFRVYRCKGRLA